MAIGVNSVMSMGVGALFASQANISVTGNNIANVNTPGYSRQAVVLDERYALNYQPGQIGQGVQAKEVIRYFDRFIEANYLSKLGTASRFTTQYAQMRTVEELFNESNVDGVGAATADFFAAWNKLVDYPADSAAREALLAKALTLAEGLNMTDTALRDLEEQMNVMIGQEVSAANQLIQEIADLNREIKGAYLKGRNNPNQLMDERDRKVRELGAIIDVAVRDDGEGGYRVTMKNGAVLVQDDVPFALEFRGPSVDNNLTANSDYKLDLPSPPGTGSRYDVNGNLVNKTAHFNGSDSREYTLEMVTDNGNQIGNGAQFKVSTDGGRTWLTNDDGSIKLFNAQPEENAVLVGELEIHFDPGQVSAGDRFVLSPKNDVYWISPTAGPQNVSTQIFPDGSDNSMRITGGSLGGYLEFRDYRIGEYRDRLNAFAESLAWEVNRVHSQGAGLEGMHYAMGTTAVGNTKAALGSPEARFAWAERLQKGNLTFAVFDENGKNMLPDNAIDVLASINFDPAKHSLEDVAQAITNATYTDENGVAQSPFVATIVNGKLEVRFDSSNPKFANATFTITSDTTGLAAGLGINSFFTGTDAESLAVRGELFNNTNLINAGALDGQGEFNEGDNKVAREMVALASKAVSISTTWNKATSQTLSQYYGTIITKVGADTQGVKFTAATESSMAQELYSRQEEISGVNLDEEMTNLIKFQASYKAAAKLITTADEMLQTLLGLKQ